MSSWGILLALSGFHCNMVEGKISFDPKLPGDFRCFWSSGTAWGTYTLKLNSETKAKKEKIEVIHGTPKNIKTIT
jgi:hypothetical protein